MAEMPTSTLNMSKFSSRIIQVILKELSTSNISRLTTPGALLSSDFLWNGVTAAVAVSSGAGMVELCREVR